MKKDYVFNREANFRNLERREWYLWWLALLIIVIYATCIIIVAQPELWKAVVKYSAGSTFLVLLLGLFVLTVLLCSYIIYREITIKRMRKQFIKDERIKTVGIFAAKIAHELNNNLTIAHGYTELLLDSNPTEKAKNDLVKIQNALNEMTYLICDLLVFCRTMKLNAALFTPVNLADLIKAVLDLYQDAFTKYNVAVKNESMGTNIKVLGDYHQLVEVFSNIIKNAIEAMNDNGVAKKELNIQFASSKDKCEIGIFNPGSTIAPQVMEHLFEPFITTKDLGKGTGLGLSISKTILEIHKGDIKAQNHPNGTSFSVILPTLANESLRNNQELSIG